VVIVARTEDGKPATLAVGVNVGEWKKESSLTVWLIVVPIVAAVLGALLLPATRRRRKTIAA
jgi:phosphate/sulfate permease